ncbi:serum response factor-binding protein 1 isoform X1 [Vespula squamosa]|uniref:Serum response factor-binding protein 1 isoform X1 n=1 Tax=Vespula squamosa TaxID=30214 RepID=A0ABD2AXU3_VESSQ
MGKIEVNDEIVRMRKLVRQARVCVIHKLTREAKTLRTKNGTEKQQEKNKKKADKLINEIYFLKKIKDDRITKFGITNTKSLQEILQNKKSKASTRIMAKVVDYKSLKNAIIQFRNTYSDYEQHLQPGKNKSTKQNKRPEQKEEENETITRRETRASSRVTENSLANESNSDDEDNNIGTETEDSYHSEQDSEAGSILRIKPTICKVTKRKENKCLKRDRKESTESVEKCNKHDNEDVRNIKKARTKEKSQEDKEQEPVKVISEQAAVKRFTEILQEQSSEKNGSSKMNNETTSTEIKSESEKKIDSFFMSGDGDAYLSLASSMKEENKYLSEDEDNNFYNNKSKAYIDKRAFANDRFFSNVKSSEAIKGRGRQKESRHNDNNFNRDKSLFKKQKNKNESFFKDTKKRDVVSENSNENENLHPSWAAKKKQQEIMKQGFQGKKIIFDNE